MSLDATCPYWCNTLKQSTHSFWVKKVKFSVIVWKFKVKKTPQQEFFHLFFVLFQAICQ